MTLEIRGGLREVPGAATDKTKSGSRSERPEWLPDVDSNHEPND